MKSINLALQAGRKRQSLETGFIHHSYEVETSRESIAVFENFCFVLTLFRTRLSEHVLEGKTLLEKLLFFQVEDNFPVYLHEFPKCRDIKLGSKIYPVIFWLLKDFHLVLGTELKKKLEKLLKTLPKPSLTKNPTSPEEWAEFLILAQLDNLPVDPALQYWHPELACYLGPQKQEGFEPAVTLYDIFLGEFRGSFSARALRDHPIHMRASLVRPATITFKNEYLPTQPLTWFWGGEAAVHSLLVDTQGDATSRQFDNLVWREAKKLNFELFGYKDEIISLPDKVVEEEIEIALFLTALPGNFILVNNQKANTFQLDESIQILSQDKQFNLKLSLISGEGRFFGHIFKGNRPGQCFCKKHNLECFDWKISLRTLKRIGPCQVKLNLDF